MKRSVIGVLVVIMLGSAWAQNTRSDTVYLNLNVVAMENLLRGFGLQTTRQQNDKGVVYFQIKLGDWDKVFVDLLDCQNNLCTSMIVYAGFTLDNPPGLDKVNLYNQQKRFVRAYVADNGDAWLEDDLDLAGGVTAANIKAWLERFGKSISEFTDAIGFKK